MTERKPRLEWRTAGDVEIAFAEDVQLVVWSLNCAYVGHSPTLAVRAGVRLTMDEAKVCIERVVEARLRKALAAFGGEK